MRRTASILGVGVLAMSTLLVAAPADAATQNKVGIRVSGNIVRQLDQFTSSYNGKEHCDFASDSTAGVKLDGDFLYVRDDCADGRSAMGMVVWPGQKRTCRNKAGYGEWARCKFNWPEGEMKHLVPGTYDADTKRLRWSHGNTVYFDG